MGNAKTPHDPSTHVNLHDITIGDIIMASLHHFDFGDTPNGPSNDDIIGKERHTDVGGDTSMILTKIFKRDKVYLEDTRKVIYIPNPPHTQDKNISQFMENYIIELTPNLYKCPPTNTHIDNHWLTGVLMGGFDNDYFTVINTSPHRKVNIRGIDNHEINPVTISNIGALDHSHYVTVIIIMHHYAHHGKGKTINYYVQLEGYKNDVNEKQNKENGGEQRIPTHEGYIFLIQLLQGFTYLNMQPYSSTEWDTLLNMILT